MLLEFLIGSLYVDQYFKDKEEERLQDSRRQASSTRDSCSEVSRVTIKLSIDDGDIQSIRVDAQDGRDD